MAGEAGDEYAAFGLSTVEFGDKTKFVDWDFDNIWGIGTIVEIDANLRPYLQWQDFVPGGVGVLSTWATEFRVYPNPTSEVILVDNIDIGSEITLYSINGILISKTISESNIMELDLRNQPDGLYIIKVNGGQSVQVVKR